MIAITTSNSRSVKALIERGRAVWPGGNCGQSALRDSDKPVIADESLRRVT
jgi:hypothetical protein